MGSVGTHCIALDAWDVSRVVGTREAVPEAEGSALSGIKPRMTTWKTNA